MSVLRKDKVKVKLNCHAMKAYGGGGIDSTSVLDGEEWSASRPGRFISRERPPGGTPLDWRLGGP
jgi:hypothetical protein